MLYAVWVAKSYISIIAVGRSPELRGFSFTRTLLRSVEATRSENVLQYCRRYIPQEAEGKQEGRKGYTERSAEKWLSTCAALHRISCSAVFIGRYGLKFPPHYLGQHSNGSDGF
jgi:hypothetical protein